MNSVRNVGKAVVFALVAQGCGGGAVETTAGGAREAESALLFEDHYSGTGTIRVYAEGEHLSLQVLGRIGIDDHLAMGQLLASGDLSQVYLTLHPEVQSAPEALMAIDARWERERAAEIDTLALERASEHPVPLIDKSRNSFLSNACQTFGTPFDAWVPDLCLYNSSATGLAQSNCINTSCDSQWIHHAGDRAFIWNEGARAGLVGFYDIVHISSTSAVLDSYSSGSLPARSWGYYSNNFDTVNYGIQSDRDLAAYGVTHHWHKVIPR
jgi:hypothetical protein